MDQLLVLTTPTRPQYLNSTLRQLEREGSKSEFARIVYSDGPLGTPCSWPLVEYMGGPSGTAPAMLAALRMMIGASGVKRTLFCEDDLLVGVEAVDRMLALDVPDDVALVSGFDLSDEFPPGTPDGLYQVSPFTKSGQPRWGALFMLFPRRTIEWLIADNDRAWRNRNAASDGVLMKCLARSPWKSILQRVPSDVDHAGDISTLASGKHVRRAAHFIGARTQVIGESAIDSATSPGR